MHHSQTLPHKVELLGIPISSRSFDPEKDLTADQSAEAKIVTFVNPHACAVAEKNTDYLEMLRSFSWVLCDGIGMVVAAKKLLGIRIDRAAFDLTSIAGPVCEWMARNEVPVVLVGGKPGISTQAGELLKQLIPGLNVMKTFSGYDADIPEARAFLVEQKNPAVICGMGAPRQEQFLIDLKKAGWTGIGFTCGGFFDQIVDRVDYYPKWVDKMNLRFLYRLLKEPRRLWRRYLIDYQVFMKRFLKEYLSR